MSNIRLLSYIWIASFSQQALTQNVSTASQCNWDEPGLWHKEELEFGREMWVPPVESSPKLCRLVVYIDEPPYTCKSADRRDQKAAISRVACNELPTNAYFSVGPIDDYTLLTLVEWATENLEEIPDIGGGYLSSVEVLEENESRKHYYHLAYTTNDDHRFNVAIVKRTAAGFELVDIRTLWL